ncbi:MAG: phenylalanine--tRNA ligase subunit beta [Acidobacteria bacterium]|nr:MAG: phenylalanine--tRNA ligase subunit beta [Acidobacteriota bacterium]
MRLSLNWLTDYVALEASASEIAEGLDAAGFEVESVRRLDDGIEGVVVGRVEAVSDHPDADKLRVCTVSYGSASEANVVCGAWNFDEGAKVAFAPIGAELPGGFRIGRRRIRGIASEGMICSEEELGLADSSDGILVLPDEAGYPLGMPITLALGLDDTVIDFDITPNRPDAMSVIGLAREASAVFGSELAIPSIELNESGANITDFVKVENESPERCPRYTARTIDGIEIGPSPEWLAARLTASGLRPINNVVDVTNYVLIECGHPLHAFDRQSLAEGLIRVRMAGHDESVETLDKVERKLTPEDLVIADAERPVAIAGIMGGAGSEITAQTKSIVLESAYFEPTGILATSKRLALRSESSARFERGTDPEGVLWASARAASLIQELAGGVVARGVIDEYPVPFERQRICLRPSRTNKILGTRIAPDEQVRLLKAIEIEVTSHSDDEIRTVAPSFRPDLTREIDLIEEVGRLHGYSNIETRLPSSSSHTGGLTPRQRSRRIQSQVLRGAGLDEIKTFSFVGPEDLLNGAGKVTRVANPLRAEESILRPSLLPGLISAARFNLAHRRGEVRFFEIGRVFGALSESGMPNEVEHLAALIAGDPVDASDSDTLGYFAIKGVLEALLNAIGISDARYEPTERAGLHSGRTAAVMVDESPIGVVGELHPSVVRDKGLGARASVFELNQNEVLGRIPAESSFQPFSRYPLALVDLAFVVHEDVAAGDLEAAIRHACGDALESIRLFDVYRGEQVAAECKSLAYALGFAAEDHTLSDDELAALRERAIDGARQECGAELRGLQ